MYDIKIVRTTTVVVGVECNVANCYRGTVLLLYNIEEAAICQILTEVLTVQVPVRHVGASIEIESRFAHTSTPANCAIFRHEIQVHIVICLKHPVGTSIIDSSMAPFYRSCLHRN